MGKKKLTQNLAGEIRIKQSLNLTAIVAEVRDVKRTSLVKQQDELRM